MTIRHFGRVTPVQLDVLKLIGVRSLIYHISDEKIRERIRERLIRAKKIYNQGKKEQAEQITHECENSCIKQMIREGRESLARRTDKDFGYNLQLWLNFLQSDPETRNEYMFPYAWASVGAAVSKALNDKSLRQIYSELETYPVCSRCGSVSGVDKVMHGSPKNEIPFWHCKVCRSRWSVKENQERT